MASFPQDTPEMGNELLNGASGQDISSTWGSPDGGINGLELGLLCSGTTRFDFQFTTKPRAVVALAPCNSAGDGWLDLWNYHGQCGYVIAYYAALEEDCPSPSGCYLTSTGPLAVPGPLVKLKSFKWDAEDSDSWVGLQPFWKTNDNWQDDKLADEGTVEIKQPKWVASSSDGEPEKSDPVAYAGPATAVLKKVTLKLENSQTTDAVLRVTSGDASGAGVPSLVFPDTPVHFADGKATIDSIVGQNAFPTEIQNFDAILTWSISLDGGQAFTDFATTQHKIFVTIGTARGFDGWGGLPERPHVTAARLNKATGDLNGLTTRKSAAAQECSRVNQQVAPGSNNLLHPGPGQDEVYGNPWAVLDSGLTGFDCLSLALLVDVQVRQVGIDADVSLGYPTSNGNASVQKLRYFFYTADGPSWVPLNYMAGTTWNNYEGYLLTRKQGQAAEAYTAYPVAGPIPPQAAGSVRGLPPEPEGRLDFAVIYQTLRAIVAAGGPDSRNGQQWWVLHLQHGGQQVLGGPVPFPLPLQ